MGLGIIQGARLREGVPPSCDTRVGFRTVGRPGCGEGSVRGAVAGRPDEGRGGGGGGREGEGEEEVRGRAGLGGERRGGEASRTAGVISMTVGRVRPFSSVAWVSWAVRAGVEALFPMPAGYVWESQSE